MPLLIDLILIKSFYKWAMILKSAISARPWYKSLLYKGFLNNGLLLIINVYNVCEYDCLVWYRDFILGKVQKYFLKTVLAIGSQNWQNTIFFQIKPLFKKLCPNTSSEIFTHLFGVYSLWSEEQNNQIKKVLQLFV